MKKLSLWVAVLLFGFAIVSCSDHAASSTDSEDTTADYTFIFWGMSGKGDAADCVDMAMLAYKYQKGTIGKNVNIAGLMKTSVSLQDNTQSDQTWYFDSQRIGTKEIPKEEITNSTKTAAQIKQTYEDAFAVLNGREYADTNYPLDNVDSLATFIKRTAEKFPARHYVLLTFGHGGGFSPVFDTPTTTKSSVSDDFRENKALAADDVVNAVKKSGVKIQTYFTHSCLMASLENMAAFSQVFDYAILSAELTYNYYFPDYMEKLTKAGDDETKMQEASRKMVDDYAALYTSKNLYTSHGFYDLRQMPNLLPILKEAADWYVENYNGADGDSIRNAMMNSVICVNFYDWDDADNTSLLRNVRGGVRALLRGDMSQLSDEDQLMNAVGGIYDMLNKTDRFAFGFVMADVLRNTLKANISQDKMSKLKDIYDRYMTALKGMAYIGTSLKPTKADNDYAYIYASPTINIFALNQDYFIPIPKKEKAEYLLRQIWEALEKYDTEAFAKAGHELLDGTPFANWAKLEDVRYNYTSSVFDQKVGWSKFLEKIQFNPSVVTNVDRWLVNDNMK